jgi:hypothetical protein
LQELFNGNVVVGAKLRSYFYNIVMPYQLQTFREYADLVIDLPFKGLVKEELVGTQNYLKP